MATGADNGRSWWWLAGLAAAFWLPLLAAPPLAAAGGWPLQSTVTRLMIALGAGVLLVRFGMPRIRPTGGWRRGVLTIGSALLITIAGCALYSTVLILLGAEALRPWDEVFRPSRLVTALGTGIAVSLVEEPVFRRFLPRRLTLGGGAVVGAVVASLLYALVHYLRPAKVPIRAEYSITDSWAVYADIFDNLLEPFRDPAPGIGLLLLGLLLCAVVARAGLAWTIGIHAGLVYYLKADACLVYWNHHGRHPVFGSSAVLYDGYLFWLVCAGGLLAMLAWNAARPARQPVTAPPIDEDTR